MLLLATNKGIPGAYPGTIPGTASAVLSEPVRPGRHGTILSVRVSSIRTPAAAAVQVKMPKAPRRTIGQCEAGANGRANPDAIRYTGHYSVRNVPGLKLGGVPGRFRSRAETAASSGTCTGNEGVNPGVTPGFKCAMNAAMNVAVNQGLSPDFSSATNAGLNVAANRA